LGVTVPQVASVASVLDRVEAPEATPPPRGYGLRAAGALLRP
jgi:hypothetical protein